MALKQLEQQGAAVIAAAGNDNYDLEDRDFFPASYAFHKAYFNGPKLHNIVPVGAIKPDGRQLASSNHGMGIPMALGEDVLSTLPKGYGRMSGTSQATAMHLHKMLINKCQEINHPKELIWAQQ